MSKVSKMSARLRSTRLHRAVERGEVKEVSTLLGLGWDPNLLDSNGRTGLLLAVEKGDKEIVTVLIPVSNVNVRDHTQWTALHWAAEEGHVDLIQMLLDADAFVDPVDNQGHTPLLLATSRGKVQAARLLIRGQASVSAKVQDGNTALHLAVGSGDIEMVDLLLSEGAVVDIATANKRGYTPKSLAKDEGNAEIFSRLDNPSKPKV